ncbi:cysteine-tryptophan domain-containing zinc finger protein 3-like isoform X2 [Henckelia pumila]|uniref:cysteine-tryptophan domain-containing zinc finger protein 3-like isoform X2 n=1 Tax=Henckelia pumila TaxID=405737 RepID=UPI003C6E7D48
MEETEVEEGEALSYHGQYEDSTIDPDIDLSYIGEKLESVLGHFQKDFEGGVSAENLGAKFGGYGSFLPTYQRSPSLSRAKSPPKVNNCDTPVSPRKLRTEDQRQNSLASPSSSTTARLPDAFGKTVSIENSLKGLPSRRVDESGFKCGVIKKSINPSDLKSLKVRIKVGSDNLSTQKNTEIYSGLGLMVSPSSSLDDSQEPTVQKLSGNRSDAPENSPTSILQIMTSFSAVHLLSPLSEDLICLIEKRKIGGDNGSEFIDKERTENSRMLANGSLPGRGDQNVVASEKTLASIELTDRKNFSGQSNCAAAIIKEKETDFDSLHCDEMVSNALKLPLISNSQYSIADAVKGMCTTATIVPLNASKSGVKGEAGRDIIKKNLDSESSLEIGRIEKLGERLGSLGKDSENKKENCSSTAAFSQKNVLKEEKSNALDQSESNVSKARNELSVETSDLPKKFVAAHMQKDQRMVDSSLISKSGKNSHANSLVSKNDSRDLQKDPEKSREMHLKDFFGDLGFEEENDESTSREIPSSGRPKDTQLLKKRNSSEYINTSKEKSEKFNDKSAEKLNPTENYHRMPSHVAPPPTSEAQTGVAPIVKEDWVLCDKCKKWRLLPLGTNPKSLPEKWLCRMLTWLPGMNRCSIPEEETTSAVRALYQPAADSILAPYSERHHNQLHNSISAAVGVPLVDAGCPVREHQNIADLNETTGQKKKHRADHSSSLFDIDGSTHSANSRKNLPTSSKNGTNLKINNKLESDADDSRASKRVKAEAHFDNGKWGSENGGPTLNAGTVTTNGFSKKSSRHKDTGGNMKKDTGLSHEIKVPDDGLVHSRKFDNNDSVRKRKGKDCHGSQSCHQNSGDFVDGWDSDQLERKKARVVKSGGKGSSGSKSRAGTDEKGRTIDKKNNNQCLSNTLVEDCLKNDRGLVHPSVAANSSSSKVSGSHKNKSKSQEVKGSPVESVSSSPLRPYNADKAPSMREKLFEKDDFKDPYSSTAVSPKRISGGEDGGNVRKEVMKKDVSRTIDNSASNMKKSEKVSSHSKDKTHTSVSDMDKDKIKEKSKSRKNKFDHRSPAKIDKFVSKNDTAGGTLSESNKVSDKSKFGGHDGQDVTKSQDKKRNLEEKSLKRSNLPEANGNGISQSLPPLGRVETETVATLQPVTGSQKENGVELLSTNQYKKAEKENGRPINLRHPTPNSHKAQDVEASSPVRRESSSHGANNALREAKDLKHLADRLKNSGSPESNGLYFQAALKFLHGASLLETGSSEGSKHNEMMHSMHIYSSTAKLCEFCAHEFEKSKDMAAAALAYKCMEVAYMRVVYYSRSSANRDRNELQNALQIVAPGESPFSSTSDGDNLNQATTDKGNVVAKVVGSPQVCGSHTITSRNRSGFIRLLNFAQDVNSAMEASRKSRNTFTAAISKLGESDICSLKMALDFNFQDVEGLLRLVRVSMEAVNHR